MSRERERVVKKTLFIFLMTLLSSNTTGVRASVCGTYRTFGQIRTYPCPGIRKEQQWEIDWRYYENQYPTNTGYGECWTQNLFWTVECWPSFHEPEITEEYVGDYLYARWSQRVYDGEMQFGPECGHKAVARISQTQLQPCYERDETGDGDGTVHCPEGEFFIPEGGEPHCPTPILIDVTGDGFDLTDGPNGVAFDLNGDGTAGNISWTSAESDDAWLALDRNSNGVIDTGLELFGNFTQQPPPPTGESRNGFNALAEYDKPPSGGNGDRIIDSSDTIFSSLRLWRDINHNGVSEATEISTLSALGVESVSLDYKRSKRTDSHGNRFLYRAKLNDAKHSGIGRWAWDVVLISGR